MQSDLEEGIQAALSVSLPPLEQLLGAVPDPLLAESLLLHHELDEALLVRLLPLQLHLVCRGHFRLLKQPPATHHSSKSSK